MDDPWEILEYVGEALVFIGVVGEVFAEWREPQSKKLGKAASIVLIIGLALSLAALIETNEHFNGTIATLNLQASKAQNNAAQLEHDAAELHKVAEDERLARVKIEKSMEWRTLSEAAKTTLCAILPRQSSASETVVITVWSDPEPALFATELKDTIGSCRPLPGGNRQGPALAMTSWTFPVRFGVWLDFPSHDAKIAKSIADALRADGIAVSIPSEKDRQFPANPNRAIVVGPRPVPNFPQTATQPTTP